MTDVALGPAQHRCILQHSRKEREAGSGPWGKSLREARERHRSDRGRTGEPQPPPSWAPFGSCEWYRVR